MKKIFILPFLLLISFFSHAQIRYFKANLQGSQQVPANGSAGTGVAIVRYNTTTKFLELWGNYQNISSAATISHIHSPGAPGVNAVVIINLTNTGGTSGTLTGSAMLTGTQESELFNSLMYVNVHNAPFPGGEIRGQLTPATDGQTELFNGRLQGAQEVPPNASTASGTVNVLLDKTKDSVWVTGSYTGLVVAANAAHIHSSAAPGANAPVVITLNFTPATSGTLDIASPIAAAVKTAMLNGTTYINVHNTTFGGGEIRAQLLSATNLRYLAGSLQGSQETAQPNTSIGRGTVIVKYNTQTNLLEFTGDYQSLNATISGSHIHGPASPGSDAGILFNLTNTGGTMGTLTGSFTLTEPQEADLLAGNMYANVHSTGTYAGGEIRAQLIPLSSGETQYLTTSLNPDEERAAFPANTITSSGVGTAVVVLDKITRNIYVTASYSNLSSGINNSHIHRGPVAVSGPVSIQLQFIAGTTSGTVTGGALNIRTALMDSIINGNSYVNIHTANYTSGEIRGQLGNLVLPVLLKYFNGYKEQNKIALIWETEQQINLDRYEIEQQNPETGKWITKSSIPATSAGTLGKLKFSDVPTNYNSTYVIYRLKMIDKDGKISYSPVVKINYKESKAELMIFGNPVFKGELNYMLTGLSSDSKTEVSVVDYNGKIVIKTIGRALINNKVNIASLSSGMYKLVVKFDDIVLQQNFLK